MEGLIISGIIIIVLPLLIGSFIRSGETGIKKIYDRRYRQAKKYESIFRRVCDNFKLTLIKGDGDEFPHIEGHYRGFHVVVKKNRQHEDASLVFKLRIDLHPGTSVHIVENSIGGRIKKFPGLEKCSIGDSEFDDAAIIFASDYTDVLLLLNRDARNSIAQLARESYSCEITRKGISIIKMLPECNSWKKISEIITLLAAAGSSISGEHDLRKRMLNNLLTEEDAGIFIKNIKALSSISEIDDGMLPVIKKAFDRWDAGIRVKAARHLGAGRAPLLLEMLRSPNGLGGDAMAEIVRMFGKNDGAQCAPVLKDLYLRGAGKKVSGEILRAFKRFGDPSLSSFLVKELNANPDMQGLIIAALGTCGTVEAVEALCNLGENTLNPLIKNAIQNAITRIQAKIGSAEKGWLSIREPDGREGGLSLADSADRGALSISNEKDEGNGKG